MRRAITAISFILSGASVLIFILALLIPLLRESPSRAVKDETDVEWFSSLRKTIAGLEQRPSQSTAVNNDLQPIPQLQNEVVQNQSKQLPASTQPVEASGLSSPMARKESATDRSEGELSAAQSLQPAETRLQSEVLQNQAKELTESTQPLETSRLSTPIAQNETANDRGQGELTIMQSLQPAITTLQGEVLQNQSKELTASSQPVQASGLSSPMARKESATDRSQGESSVIQSSQISPETVAPEIKEKSTQPFNPPGAKKKRTPQKQSISLLVLGEGLFPVGEGTPKASMQEAIDKIIPFINARSPDKVVVEGHADKWIPDGVSPAEVSKFNKIVSLQRASAVAKVLEQKGVAPDRIIVKGLGDAVPLASNRTNAGRAKNRRVEIKLKTTQ